MIVLTLLLTLASGAPTTMEIREYLRGDEPIGFASLSECSMLAQPLAAQFIAAHPGVRLDAFTCGPETASH